MDNHHNRKEEGFNFDEQQAGFVMGAVVGALVGGAAALLLSPKNGKEMREIVKKYSKELEREAHDLAKDARGTATSFKSVLQEGAVEVMEQAPEKLEQAGYQAQQLADDLSQRFESARDVVAELAEAFRSGWEEYGDDQPEDELDAAPALLTDDDVTESIMPQAAPEPILHNADSEADQEEEVVPVAPTQARRRTQVSTAYSMHSSVKEADELVEEKPEKAPEAKKEEPTKPKRAAAASYTRRVIDEPKKIETVKKPKAEEVADKKPAAPKKKLLFRRSS